MGRIIEGQIIASTNVDKRGDRITPNELRGLLMQMPDERFLSLDHDPRVPPVARAFNTRVEQLENGEFAIKSDIEVFDEDVYATLRGFSISFTQRDPDVQGDHDLDTAIINFNPGQLSRASLEEIVRTDPLAGRVALSERSDRSLVAAVVLIWAVVSHGFWDEAGKDLYRLCRRLVAGATSKQGPTEAGVMITRTDQRPEIVIALPLEDNGPDPVFSCDDLVERAKRLAPGSEIVKIVASVDDSGEGKIDFVVDRHGVSTPGPG
jgi:hypothetical protein